MGGWNSYFDAPLLTALLNAQGIPPIDQAAEVFDETINLAVGANYDSAIIDMAKYNSISVVVDETNGAAGSCTVPRDMYIWAYADAAGTVFMNGDRYQYYPSGGGILITPAMIKGPYIQLSFGALAVGAAAVITASIVGSMRQTGPQARIELLNAQVGAGMTDATGDEGIWFASNVAWPVGSGDEYPITYCGPATFGWEVNAVTTLCYARFWDPGLNVQYAAINFPPSATFQRGFLPIYLPMRPLRFRFFNADAAVKYCTFCLIMDGAR